MSDLRLAVTGTPGTGKTSATAALPESSEVIHLNAKIREHGLSDRRDETRDSLIADLEAVRGWLGDWSGIVESHLAHHLDADRVVVLRCRPDILEQRLRDRGESPKSAAENAESEALDIILSEALDRHGEDAVYEIDTTERPPETIAEQIHATVTGDRDPSAGEVEFLRYL